MQRKRRNGGMREYLDELGVLEKGSDEEIRQAKVAYRRKYFTEYKRRQRSLKKEFVICLSSESGELSFIQKGAKDHLLTVPAFIKESCLAYLKNQFVVPDKYVVAKLEQQLASCLNEVKSIAVKKERLFFSREDKLAAIEKVIIELQSFVYNTLRNPPSYSINDSKNQVA